MSTDVRSYRLDDLKQMIRVTDEDVECPVLGCSHLVARQRHRFSCRPAFFCPGHGIYISPSTFEYADPRRNFPLVDDADWLLLTGTIAADKRETHRLARERSEDAVTYNAFRSLERVGLMPALCGLFTDRPQAAADLVYWSHSLRHAGALPELDSARRIFGERPSRGSEPDLIAVTPTDLIFIEVKLTSSNETTPTRPEVLPVYASAAGGWYEQVFAQDAFHVAVTSRKYELMRFWLLGTWMAERAGKHFTLVTLTREIQDMDLEDRVSPMLLQSDGRQFARWPWEAIADFADRHDAAHVSEYLWSKSVGYDAGVLRPMLAEIDY